MRIGYARVSTVEQNLDLQIDALKAAQCGRIYEEHASGKNAGRAELQNCLKALRAGDTFRDAGDIVDLDQLVSRLAALEWKNANAEQAD